jgi:hypothetical protein
MGRGGQGSICWPRAFAFSRSTAGRGDASRNRLSLDTQLRDHALPGAEAAAVFMASHVDAVEVAGVYSRSVLDFEACEP